MYVCNRNMMVYYSHTCCCSICGRYKSRWSVHVQYTYNILIPMKVIRDSDNKRSLWVYMIVRQCKDLIIYKCIMYKTCMNNVHVIQKSKFSVQGMPEYYMWFTCPSYCMCISNNTLIVSLFYGFDLFTDRINKLHGLTISIHGWAKLGFHSSTIHQIRFLADLE